ncbi:hypothetical protein [Streptomyces sp. NPDC102360]|uniref:hypothetical protein n=1 Tax=Streptomyces sp. NPDC102360 TaxID=3366160 RepID=UPI003819BDC6
MKTAPASGATVSNRAWVAPTTLRTRCGSTRPTKAMAPLAATSTYTRTDAAGAPRNATAGTA